MSVAFADGLILAVLAVVILLAVRYARRHPKVPPELSQVWHSPSLARTVKS